MKYVTQEYSAMTIPAQLPSPEHQEHTTVTYLGGMQDVHNDIILRRSAGGNSCFNYNSRSVRSPRLNFRWCSLFGLVRIWCIIKLRVYPRASSISLLATFLLFGRQMKAINLSIIWSFVSLSLWDKLFVHWARANNVFVRLDIAIQAGITWRECRTIYIW